MEIQAANCMSISDDDDWRRRRRCSSSDGVGCGLGATMSASEPRKTMNPADLTSPSSSSHSNASNPTDSDDGESMLEEERTVLTKGIARFYGLPDQAPEGTKCVLQYTFGSATPFKYDAQWWQMHAPTNQVLRSREYDRVAIEKHKNGLI